MARRARARKAAGKPKASPGSPEDRLVEAALRLAARQGWRGTGLADIAAEAGLPLDQAYAACRSKQALLAAFIRRVDRTALAGVSVDHDAPWRDRLFDALMRRFDALQAYKPALAAILRDSVGDPQALFAAPQLFNSMAWMLEAAGIPASGWRGRVRVRLVTALYLSVLRVFLHDDSADLAKTMAALDRRLRRAESWFGRFGGWRGGPDRATA